MINNNSNKYFQTNDLAVTTALSIFIPIIAIDKQNPRKVQFIFERNQKLNSLLDRYWKKEILVEPRQYFDQLKALKVRIYGNE
jgi:hypothetical protein